jgi:branched-chain amino acid transport system permease protein
MVLVYLYGFMSMGWNILGGYTGQVSLGHAVYFGIGAYTSTTLFLQSGLSPWLGMPLGVSAAVITAMIISYPCFQLKGHYFAIATICLGEIVRVVFINWERVGGATGMGLPIEYSFSAFQFASKVPYYYITLFFLAAALFLTGWIERRRMGYYLRAIKMDQEAARSLGIDTRRYKMAAMALSAGITAIAGTIYAQFVLYIDPESVFASHVSIIMCLISVLGGTHSKWGPILGALVLIPLQESTRFLWGGGGYGIDLIVYALLIMGIAVFQPEGLIGVVTRMETSFKGRFARRTPA